VRLGDENTNSRPPLMLIDDDGEPHVYATLAEVRTLINCFTRR